jgi:hypothetical protein
MTQESRNVLAEKDTVLQRVGKRTGELGTSQGLNPLLNPPLHINRSSSIDAEDIEDQGKSKKRIGEHESISFAAQTQVQLSQ